ncbi:MAG TPA: hypothetical protein VK151_04585 [Fluviicola sp.]|nr:hypothetical protein [Fluviicola sp.]
MKTTIRSSAIMCFAFTVILMNACSGETADLHVKSSQPKTKKETTPKQQSPQLLVQQFGGCKAHR